MYLYQISTGEFSHNGTDKSRGYSGSGVYRNDPNSVHLAGLGPIPPGDYTIGEAFDSPHTGPCVMRLTPKPGTDTFGRSDFEMHGDSKTAPGSASHGCIILDHETRLETSQDTDKDLKVIP